MVRHFFVLSLKDIDELLNAICTRVEENNLSHEWLGPQLSKNGARVVA